MGKSTATSNNLLKLLFNATNWALIADNTATTPLASLYVALHTADPGIGGTQSTNEVTYTSYATGYPKGAAISHRAEIARAMIAVADGQLYPGMGSICWSPNRCRW